MKNLDTAIIMYYWNHFKRISLFRNFNVCYNHMLKYECVIVPIEISTNNSFDLNMQGLFALKSDQLLWQKERVINYLAEKMPDSIKYIAFIDGDVLFSDDNWVQEAKNKLDQKENLFIQPFSDVYYLPKNHYRNHGFYSHSTPSVSSQIIKSDGKENYIKTFNSSDYTFGNPGMAWITKKETLLNNPLYDKCIIGGGDTINLFKWLNLSLDIEIPFIKRKQDSVICFLKDILNNKSNVEINFDYIDQPIFHLNHGDKVNRKYIERQKILKDTNFNVSKDLVNDQGLYRYVGDNKDFLKSIENYFKERNEDLE